MILHASLQALEHNISLDDTYAIYDEFVDEGNTLIELIPIIVEILIMEVSFELIREAGLRVPSPIGPTIRNCWCTGFRTSCCKCWHC
mgnify:CR=1 FL=1